MRRRLAQGFAVAMFAVLADASGAMGSPGNETILLAQREDTPAGPSTESGRHDGAANPLNTLLKILRERARNPPPEKAPAKQTPAPPPQTHTPERPAPVKSAHPVRRHVSVHRRTPPVITVIIPVPAPRPAEAPLSMPAKHAISPPLNPVPHVQPIVPDTNHVEAAPPQTHWGWYIALGLGLAILALAGAFAYRTRRLRHLRARLTTRVISQVGKSGQVALNGPALPDIALRCVVLAAPMHVEIVPNGNAP